MTSQEAVRSVATAMAEAATAWLDSLTDEQRPEAAWPGPADNDDAETERQRWFFTPTDHGGLRINQQQPAQQQLAMRLVASGLSEAAYNTVGTIMGLENLLDRAEDWQVDWGRERGRDPGCYYLRVFGTPGATGVWAWRFGGHHVSLNNLVVDGRVVSTTPCFIGADPATSVLLGSALLRPLSQVEDLARELVRSLDGDLAARAILHPRAPSEIIGGNRPFVSAGDQMVRIPQTFRAPFTDQRLIDRVQLMDQRAEAASGYTPQDHAQVALTDEPRGVAGKELDEGQRDLLRTLLRTYVGRAPETLVAEQLAQLDGSGLDAVHVAWAGPTEPGQPHYYRVQGPDLLLEYDNTQRSVNHVHSVWRNPSTDFGLDLLRAHRSRHHR